MHLTHHIPVLFSLFLSAANLHAKAPELIKQARVTELITYLSSDELAGRDTPSPGLEEAASYIAAAFKAAGLKPGAADGSYFHQYEAPGLEVDSSQVELTLISENGDKPLVLNGDTDVRIFQSPDRAYDKETAVTVLQADKAAEILDRKRPRNPVFIVVEETSPLWKAMAGKRQYLSRQHKSPSAPYLLIRKKSLGKFLIASASI